MAGSLDSKGEEEKTISGCWKAEISVPQNSRWFFFFFKALKQREKTEVSWTKGKLMNNPLGVRSQLGFVFTHYYPEVKNLKTTKEPTSL